MRISTHTPHAGRDLPVLIALAFLIRISTHTPHAGRDLALYADLINSLNFYSHAPCGARRIRMEKLQRTIEFLLTRPMRGATTTTCLRLKSEQFLLTRPMRGATRKFRHLQQRATISTHTPHAGRDVKCFRNGTGGCHFYSHAPCGARLRRRSYAVEREQFLLTRPMRGATSNCSAFSGSGTRFLLTRPMRGATQSFAMMLASDFDFYSHAPCGARRHQLPIRMRSTKISTHTPHAGRDRNEDGTFMFRENFYSHAPCGARQLSVG